MPPDDPVVAVPTKFHRCRVEVNGGLVREFDRLETKGLATAVFPREAFLSVLAGMQPTVDAKSHRLVIEADAAGTAALSTSSITGEAESSDLDVNTPDSFTLHFDSTLLQTAVRQLKGDEFEFYFTKDAKGVLLKSPKDDEFKTFVCTLKKVD